jgi:hypothetical protein
MKTESHIAWTAAIREPERVLAWSAAEWDLVVRLGRRLRLLARLAESLAASGLLEHVPDAPRRHLLADREVSRHRTAAMRWALERVRAVTGAPSFPRVLLKGSAYLAQDLPIAAGRLPSDVDILVPRAHLADAQRALSADGWSEVPLDAHDRRYYLEWSHELPPMRHPVHPIELDLHHDILPPVARTRVEIDKLLKTVQPSPWPGWQVLQPTDQVLHCAANLFLDAQAHDRLRDLIDLDGLLRHFGRTPSFFGELVTRAVALGLAEPLALGVRLCREWLGTPMTAADLALLRAHEPAAARRWWLLPALRTVLAPAHPDASPPWQQTACGTLLLARYHLARMPLRALVPHLAHKLRGRPAAIASTGAPAREPE